MPKYFMQPTKHLFGSLLLLTAHMLKEYVRLLVSRQLDRGGAGV